MDYKELERKTGDTKEGKEAFFAFIAANAKTAAETLRLRHRGKEGLFDIGFAIDQIECRRRTRGKLPTFVENERVLFPAVISSEQSSDEGIARFHSKLVEGERRVADLTAGLGIDAIHLAEGAEEVTAVELEPLRAQVLGYNIATLGIRNLKAVNADCLEWLPESGKFDTLFIDPARRGEQNSRKYRFCDCAPDITVNLEMLLSHCDRLLVKASPLLDISAICEELPGVEEIWILSRKGECKEILISVRRGESLRRVTAGEVDSDGAAASFTAERDMLGNEGVKYAEAEPEEGGYLYEPSAAVMKMAPWGEICRRWPGLCKVGRSSNLFYSKEGVDGFPGRELLIDALINSKRLKRYKGEKANIVCRNYPMTPAELKKRAGIIDGGDAFIVGTRWGEAEKPLLLHGIKCDRTH